MAKLLIVEDDPDQRREYARYLRSPDGGGHEVREAGSATCAVEMITAGHYDLVLLDVMMAYQDDDDQNPAIDDNEVDFGRKMGLHVYKAARRLDPAPPIALISVVRDPGVLQEFADVVGYLGKYFSLDELGRKVHEWLPTTR